MNIHTLSLFPELIKNSLSEGVIQKAVKNKLLSLSYYDLRDFGIGKYKQVDDTIYGGGPGMVLKPEPIFDGVNKIKSDNLIDDCPVILMSPQGKVLNQKMAKKVSKYKDIIVIAGRYEGVDERVRQHLVTDEISIGDYVLSGGELPAMVVADAVVRLIPGVLGSETSAVDDSYATDLLEYPQYTRPPEYRGWAVPEVLLSGNHGGVARWRREQAVLRTLQRRPELLNKASLSSEEKHLLSKLKTLAE